MNEGIRRSAAIAGAGLLAVITACSADEVEAEESSESAPTESEASEAQEPVADEWADHMWDEHVEGLVAWWNEHYEADCSLSEPECVEHFTSAREMLYDFSEDMRDLENYENRPDYVPSFYGGEVNRASREMERYYYACFIDGECSPGADGLEQEVYELISETDSWWD